MKYILFNTIELNISDDDFDFLCKHRFHTNNPSLEDVEKEFVKGTGIYPRQDDLNNFELHKRVDFLFSYYVQYLKDLITEIIESS